MAKLVLQELEMRIHQLREVERQSYLDEEQKKCIQCRRSELENLRTILNDRLRQNELKKVSSQEFWKLVDEF